VLIPGDDLNALDGNDAEVEADALVSMTQNI
jgi:hypothetical protein